jgi:hypothetical protein
MIFRRNEYYIFLQSTPSFDPPLQEAIDLTKKLKYSLSTDLTTFGKLSSLFKNILQIAVKRKKIRK